MAKGILTSVDLKKYQTDTTRAIKNLEAFLRKEHVAEIEVEYQSLGRKRRKRIEWFSLFNGPTNLRDLAGLVERRAQYDFLYRGWSELVHAVGYRRFITRKAKGEYNFNNLRNSKELRSVALDAATFLLGATRSLLLRFRPGEEGYVKKWYLQEIRGSFMKLLASQSK
jgi:hypothetical protein